MQKFLKNESINKQYNAHTYIKKKKENILKCSVFYSVSYNLVFFLFVLVKFLGGGRNVEFQNYDWPIFSERRNGLFSFSQLQNQNVENGFLVYHYYENKNVKKNIENQK